MQGQLATLAGQWAIADYQAAMRSSTRVSEACVTESFQKQRHLPTSPTGVSSCSTFDMTRGSWPDSQRFQLRRALQWLWQRPNDYIPTAPTICSLRHCTHLFICTNSEDEHETLIIFRPPGPWHRSLCLIQTRRILWIPPPLPNQYLCGISPGHQTP